MACALPGLAAVAKGGRVVACLALAAAVLLAAGDAQARARAKAKAKAPECPAAGTQEARVSGVSGGRVFAVAGGEIRLAGILPFGEGGEPPPTTAAAKPREALSTLLAKADIRITPAGMADRYGRMPALVFANGVWVQEALVRAGLARVEPDLPLPCAAKLLAAEAAARTAHAGHWGDGLFDIAGAFPAKECTGSFQIVEAAVTTASVVKGRAYINFGADYCTDFTVTVAPPDMKAFRAAKFDVRKLAGKRVRVRGWLESYNGPEMEITSPAAIEVLQ